MVLANGTNGRGDFALQKDAELNYTTNWVQQRWLGWQAAWGWARLLATF